MSWSATHVWLLVGCGLLLLAGPSSAGGYGPKNGHLKPKVHPSKHQSKYPGLTLKPVPTRPAAEMPSSYDWCEQRLCTASWNQHIPKYCGSCWIHGTLAALQDRIKIANGRGRPVEDVILARQDLLDCGESAGFGHACNGGNVHDVYEYMRCPPSPPSPPSPRHPPPPDPQMKGRQRTQGTRGVRPLEARRGCVVSMTPGGSTPRVLGVCGAFGCQ